ncbi:peroxisome biogenesis factor 2-like protein [Dinothrombium tinctorium]|uniref:RING-type E3 ubiquitin transferase (cysteine targeting) n=1 Tax=Dinothrombium tinctorium TaxID=1965070 RepID=A0A443R321_9ACAR|nr:peroxisome biogenesis factor 2-like protein [Dinothrombium tinctorium]
MSLLNLDASLLDNELKNLLFSQLSNVFKHIHKNLDVLHELRPEIETAIALYISYHSVVKKHATVGQSLLELKLVDTFRDSTDLRKTQLCGFILSTILVPWIKQRSHLLFDVKHQRVIDHFETLYKVLNLVNFLVFLNSGQFVTLWQRAIKLNSMYCPLESTSLGSHFEMLNREILWHGLAQFLTFILPFISFQRMKNSILSLLNLYFKPQKPCGPETRSKSDLVACGICTNWPNNAHEIGCKHVFCYYCIMSNFLSDTRNGFNCPLCLYHVSRAEDIRQLRMSIEASEKR